MFRGNGMMSRLVLGAGLALGVIGGFASVDASAQDARKEAKTASNSSSRSQSSMTVIDNGDQYTIQIVDGKVHRAEVNGLEIAKDLVRERDGAYQIINDAGEVLVRFPKAPAMPVLPPMPGFPAWIGELDRPEIDRDDPAFRGIIRMPPPLVTNPPRTMLGISHSDVDEQLRWFLDLEPGTARVVTRVVEGLPAAKGGLEKYDIIVKLDGREPVTAALLTEVLNERDPGDEIELRVIRKGEQKTITIELEKYERQALSPVDEFFGFAPPAEGAPGRLRDQLARIERDAQGFVLRRDRDGAAPRLLIEREASGEARLRRQVEEYEQKLAEYEARMEQMVSRMDRLLELLEERER